MIVAGSSNERVETRAHSGLLLALFELSAELEPAEWEDPSPVAGGPPTWADPGRSSVLLETLHRDWRRDGPQRAKPSAAGRQLGRYRLIERLGQGSQAEVWKAIRLVPEIAVVALKVLPAALAEDPGRQERFRLEARLGARLAGPALLPTYDFGEHEGTLFLAMPLVEGGSLFDVIAHRRTALMEPRPGVSGRWTGLSPDAYTRAVTRVVVQVSRALALVHASRVVHRDVKPANILLDRQREDHAFLCDFGLGRDLDDDARPASWHDGAGTPLYMAPEKLLGRAVDEIRCDIYSLGVTLFEALTLVHPFPAPRSIPQTCLAAYLAAAIPPRPREVQPRLPAPLEAIIVKAMDRDPAARYGAVAGLADDLEAFLAAAPVRVHAVMSRRPAFVVGRPSSARAAS